MNFLLKIIIIFTSSFKTTNNPFFAKNVLCDLRPVFLIELQKDEQCNGKSSVLMSLVK